MRKFNLLLSLTFLLSVLTAKAQDSTSTGPGQLTISGYLDTYYNWAFNKPKSGSLLGYTGAGRAFDRTTNTVAIGLLQTKLTYTTNKIEIVADLAFGPNAELGNFGNVNAQAYTTGSANLYTNPAFSNIYGSSACIKQAYGTFKATDKLSFTVGQFGTHIGYEVIDAPVNYNYSLSNLFNNGPFYHVGAKADYAFSDKFGVMLGLVNNWDNLFDNNKQKSGVAQVFVSPIENLSVYVNWIGGYNDDTALDTIGGVAPWSVNYNRHLFDLTVGYQVTDKFYIGLNSAYGFYSAADNNTKEAFKALSAPYGEDKSTLNWGGIAGYAHYDFTDFISLGVRYEHFKDKYGVRYLMSTNNSLTITAPITLAQGALVVKPEFRMDTSPSKIYEDKNGDAVNSQTTFGLAAIFKF
jgi:hypothetical protein